MNLPSVALSVRQPWAWFIVAGHKDVENRTWPTKYRGPILIHAGARFVQRDVVADTVHAASISFRADRGMPSVTLEMFEGLTGGIVGVATVVDCVRAHSSPWAESGCWHWVLADARPLPFMPCKGRLGLFPVDYAALATRQGVLA